MLVYVLIDVADFTLPGSAVVAQLAVNQRARGSNPRRGAIWQNARFANMRDNS